MRLTSKELYKAICAGLTVSAVGVVGMAGTAVAQDSEERTLERIEVTGSRIKRADVEGPSPITVVERADIDVSGELSVADFLRNNVYNSAGSFRESSGSNTGSYASVSLRGIGAAYTLVLLDGRRLTASGATNGTSVDMNMIPMAAVERIEILREGAAAVYGSDAIGGVINIITRRDYEGLAMGVGYASPTRDGRPDEQSAYIVAGASSDRGNITVTMDHATREMMMNAAILRDPVPEGFWYPSGLSAFNSAANLFIPGQGLFGAPNCQSYELSELTGHANARCGFDHGQTSANESSLQRDSLFVKGNYQLTDNLDFFFRSIQSNTNSLGIYAAAPVDTFPTIAADNPFNWAGVDGTLYYRFTPLGTRDSVRKTNYRDFVAGVAGISDLFGGADWELAFTHGRATLNSINYNYGIGSTLQNLIDSGEYNPFDPTHPSVAAAAPLINHTVLAYTEQRTVSVDGNIGFDLFELAGRPVGFVTGFEYRDDRLTYELDAQSVAGNVFGSAGSNSGGERASYGVYFESLVPILETLSLTLAGRYDSYNDVGSKFSPRVSLEFRPLDSLLLRATWGKGFRAPSMDDLYGASGSSNNPIAPITSLNPPHPGGDELACAALTSVQNAIGDPSYMPYPTDPCGGGQFRRIFGSNPNLVPEESENYGIGAVFSPTENFSIALDYYNIEIENIIGVLPLGLNLRLADQGVPGFWAVRGDPITAPNGTVMPGPVREYSTQTNNTNYVEVNGIDLEVNYRLLTDAIGTFNFRLSASHQMSYDTDFLGSAGISEQAGTWGRPKDRAQLGINWGMNDFGVGYNLNYVGDSGTPNPDRVQYGADPSWVTHDIQANWGTPWNGKVTLGVRNLTDKDPPLFDASPYYDNTLHNVWGRVPYVRYEQNF